MDSFAAPARPIVARMTEAALAEPNRAVAFQGAPGANSHIAVLQDQPDAVPLPCFSFEDAIDAVQDGRARGEGQGVVRGRGAVAGRAGLCEGGALAGKGMAMMAMRQRGWV